MATSQVETVNTGADKAKLAVVAALVIASVAGFYLLSKQGAVAQWAALIVGLLVAVGVFLVSEPGRQFVAFARDAWREVKKVVWPTRKEVVTTTIMVFIMAALTSIFFFLVDLVIQADAPDEYKTYLHRSGRTGRAGRSGRVVTLITRQRQRRMTELLGRAEIDAPFENARLDDDVIEEIAGRVPTAADLTA